MPAKRRQPKTRPNSITPEAIAAFRNRDSVALRRALGLKPWEANPLDVERADAELGIPSPYGDSVPKGLALRKQLEARVRDIAEPA